MTYRFIVKLAAAASLTAILTACAHSQMPTKTVMSVSEIEATYKRPNLVVSDIERSMALYADLLGFAPGKVNTSSSDSFSYPVFNIAQNATIRSVTFEDAQDVRAFALTEVSGMILPTPPARPHMTAHVIGVKDLPGKIAAVKALGLSATESKTAQGTDFTFIEQAFTDYDGHLIVLYEILRE